MSEILYGAPVAERMRSVLRERIAALADKGVSPCLALVRVGEDGGSKSYERAAVRACETLGITASRRVLPPDCDTETLVHTLREISADPAVHGCLLLRPLPHRIREETAFAALCPEKDVDGITDHSLRRVFVGRGPGFCPCTPEAVLALLDYYRIPLDGVRVTVVGRSLVVGRPLSLLLTGRNATVTLCHRHTRDLPARCREADILIAAAGSAGLIDADCVGADQIVLDIGTNVKRDGGLCGDVDFAQAEPVARAISPVPGGVGTVTTAVLLEHVVEAAERLARQEVSPEGPTAPACTQ